MKMKKSIVVIRMERGNQSLKEVVVTDDKGRREAGLVKINPKDAINIPYTNRRDRKPDQDICGFQQ